MGHKKVYIWGAGKNGMKVLDCLAQNCEMRGFIDNNPQKTGSIFGGYPVVPLMRVEDDCDFIILSIQNTESVKAQIERDTPVFLDRLVAFYAPGDLCDERYKDILINDKWHVEILENRVRKLEQRLEGFSHNAGFEIADGIARGKYLLPKIGDWRDAIKKMVERNYSFVRYGDGEFEMMAGRERLVYHNYRKELAERLNQIINARNDKLLIGIAADYGNLDHYQDITIDGIREYFTPEVRKCHMSMLDMDYTYYDAGMFKCYFPYRDKSGTKERVDLVRSIWEDRDVLLVEGELTRSGVGNDLFANTHSLRRILCPAKNAFDKYDDILRTVREKAGSIVNCLILIILGPTSVPLVYDLLVDGIQAIDLGQIDMDYEWYLAKAVDRLPIYGKYVSQLPETTVPEISDEGYKSQIIGRIS
ncbi:MAG: GT-D fold domain-containing protein [Lachnospiraceae bacterium]|nr:GT-D fold domain-containing protein [Lachnospiraceae bacterium]